VASTPAGEEEEEREEGREAGGERGRVRSRAKGEERIFWVRASTYNCGYEFKKQVIDKVC
jgi:hypothetical protein